MERKLIELNNYKLDDVISLCGVDHQNIRLLAELYNCDLILLDDHLEIKGENIEGISDVITMMLEMIVNGQVLNERDVIYLTKLQQQNRLSSFLLEEVKPVGYTAHGKVIVPKTLGQRYLCRAMNKNDIVFASGPAGSGKTYLAVVHGVNLMKKGLVKKIILTRPAVEAGENLGFLPGDLKEKVDPYLRPLYDALYDCLGKEKVETLLEKEVIEIAPLAYMRGRTLDNAFIILDEAQNTTCSQMKMFLTRMGFNSKIVVTGDITQIDLIKKKDSGLVEAKQILKGVKGIGFVELTNLDVVRHPLVQQIIERYEQKENHHE